MVHGRSAANEIADDLYKIPLRATAADPRTALAVLSVHPAPDAEPELSPAQRQLEDSLLSLFFRA